METSVSFIIALSSDSPAVWSPTTVGSPPNPSKILLPHPCSSCPGSADHMLRIECLCLFPHSYTEALTSSVTVLRGGACVSGRVRTRRDARGRCEVPARRRLRRPGGGPSSEVEAGSSFTLEFPVSRTMKTKCLSHSVYGTLA